MLFCKSGKEKGTINLFHICRKTQVLWTQLTSHLNGHFNLPYLIPQSAIFGFLNISNQGFLVVNHLLVLFKYSIKNARDRDSKSSLIASFALS